MKKKESTKIRIRDRRILKNMEKLSKPGHIIVQQSEGRTGKSERARVWAAKDPENRRIVDGDSFYAYLVANGPGRPTVCLNLLPGMI